MPATSVKATSPQSGEIPEQHGTRGAGEADMRQRMAGEGLRAQHEEESDEPADHRDDAGGGERVLHEVIREHGACHDRASWHRADGRRVRHHGRPT